MTSQWPDNCDDNTWQVISNSLDIDFIHGDIHGRSCKNSTSLPPVANDDNTTFVKWWNIRHIWNWKKTPYTSAPSVSYAVFVVSILQENQSHKTKSHRFYSVLITNVSKCQWGLLSWVLHYLPGHEGNQRQTNSLIPIDHSSIGYVKDEMQ